MPLVPLSPGAGHRARAVADRNFDMAWDDRGRLVTLYTSRFAGIGGLLYSRVWDAANLTVPPAAQHPENGWGIAVEQPLTRSLGTSSSPIIPVFLDIAKDPESNELIAMLVDEGGIEIRPEADELLTIMLRWNGFGWSERARLDDAQIHSNRSACRPTP